MSEAEAQSSECVKNSDFCFIFPIQNYNCQNIYMNS